MREQSCEDCVRSLENDIWQMAGTQTWAHLLPERRHKVLLYEAGSPEKESQCDVLEGNLLSVKSTTGINVKCI